MVMALAWGTQIDTRQVTMVTTRSEVAGRIYSASVVDLQRSLRAPLQEPLKQLRNLLSPDGTQVYYTAAMVNAPLAEIDTRANIGEETTISAENRAVRALTEDVCRFATRASSDDTLLAAITPDGLLSVFDNVQATLRYDIQLEHITACPNLVWSPDDRSIVVLGGGERDQLQLVDIATGQATIMDCVVQLAPERAIRDIHWSTTQDRFVLLDESRRSPSMVVHASGEFCYHLDDDTYGVPIWSPDGRWLAYSVWQPDNRHRQAQGDFYYITEISGEGGTVLTEIDGCDNPQWTPDSQQMTCLRIEYDQSHLYTLNINTQELEYVLTVPERIHQYAHWRDVDPQHDG